jgi:hypothetical protein
MSRRIGGLPFVAFFAVLMFGPASAGASPFLSELTEVSPVASTVPATNGDLNPYGVTNVPRSVGALVAGDTLVSNFNNSQNESGRGSTIVQISPSGAQSVFAQIEASKLPGRCPGGVGLTTALTVLPNGYVVVGSLPTANATPETAKAGCLIVLNSVGEPVQTIAGGPINGPWDLSATSLGTTTVLYVTNVLNGTVASGETPVDRGTVVRIVLLTLPGQAPEILSKQVIATGFPERTNPIAIVIGPTGSAVQTGPSWLEQTLYVADSVGDRIAAVPNALLRVLPQGGGGITVSAGDHLNTPLAMTLAPNGDILTTDAGDGNIVETTPAGNQVATFNTGAGNFIEGGLFGLTLDPQGTGVLFANDTANELDLLH